MKGKIQHSKVNSQNQIATLLRWSMDLLSPPARTALEFASLLEPDKIPLDWLQFLTSDRYPEIMATPSNAPSKWSALWYELFDLKLIHQVGPSETDTNAVSESPQAIRLHRMVAAHVAKADIRASQTLGELDQFVQCLGSMFEHRVGKGPDSHLRPQFLLLRHQIGYLVDKFQSNSSLLRSAGTVAYYESEHQSLSGALDLTSRILAAMEKSLSKDPKSSFATRDLVAMLNKQSDLLVKRGRTGDHALAFRHLQRSKEILENLAKIEPESNSAKRDLCVILAAMSDFLGRRNHFGDAAEAILLMQQSLGLRQEILTTSPHSSQALRDVNICLLKIGKSVANQGLFEDTERAIKLFEQSIVTSKKLLTDNPQSAEAAREHSLAFYELGKTLTKRGFPSDAEAALLHFQNCLDLQEEILRVNPDSAQANRDLMNCWALPKTACFKSRLS